MKTLKKIMIAFILVSFVSCSIGNKSHYGKFHKTHKKVKDNSKY